MIRIDALWLCTEPQIVDGGMATGGRLAHTLISRFVDHLPYYRQEACVHRPRACKARRTTTADHPASLTGACSWSA
ncbi:hypothetical protein [Piscinibacter koreensis]|uniref:Uncharacterized protein n=1 Tax=Piscinibacter koreensis TaxID=2742824 RepID=A0A7Y6NSG4_9BURK|nr:hypothetical protein [Schlegelella koreensis]NUZ08500.1 hypothetical protein [Schlegelella koreensis]